MTAMVSEKKQYGFSLVELMVGMVLGLMLISGAVSIYLASKQSYVEVEQVGALTESARFSEQLIGDSLRHAGFFGEVTANKIEADPNLTSVAAPDCAGPASAHNLNQFIYAATVDSSNNALGCIDDGMEGTDVLVIKRVAAMPYSDGPRESFDPNDPTHGDGTIDTPDVLQNDKTYVMTNNVNGVMFDGNDTPPSITSGGAIPGGTAWEYQYEVFYIRDPDPTSKADTPQLSRKTLVWNGTAMELETEDIAEGVENLRIMLGYDSTGDGDVDTYKTPATIASWSNVESVEVFMLTRSATRDVQYTDDKTYKLAGSDITPPADERNYRRLISHASVSLRNLKLMIRGGA